MDLMSFLFCLAVSCCLCASVAWCWRRRRGRQGRRRCLAVVTRYPTPGTTKTRLIPRLGERGAALVQLHMTEKIIDIACSLHDKNIHTEVVYTGGTESDLSYWLGKRRRSAGLSWRPQSAGGLGNKLSSLFSSLFSEGAMHIVTVGADIPGITGEIIQEAFSQLEEGTPLVLGRAEDGGYYLIGLSAEVSDKTGALFSDIDWGTERVFSQQMERATGLGIRAAVLPTALSDVDTADDLPVFEAALGLTSSQLLEPHLSVIIPAYNEKDNIIKTLNNIIQCTTHVGRVEVIVSDGGSTDGTQQAVEEFATKSWVPVTLVRSPPGRGPQLKCGTTFAKGDNFLFLHADSVLPHDYDDKLHRCLEGPGIVAGAFQFDFDLFRPELWTEKVSTIFSLKMRIIRRSTQLRAVHLELPYGDQGLFMSRRTYERVGGFQEVYLMEDYMMVEALRKIGHVHILPDPLLTSARRWHQHGAFRITGLNLVIAQLYRMGVKPNTLAQWYYGDKLKKILSRKDN